jgi:NTP pyrophosphatase (non-canonical NTP hydrolase)
MKEKPIWNAETDRRMALQKAEFDAADELAKQIRRHSLTAVVDDDYPEVRSDYECALRNYIDALRANGRFSPLPNPNLKGDFMDRLRAANASRGKRWHPSGLVSWSLSDWFTALAGEVGELGNVVKKMNRFRDGLKGNKEGITELTAMLQKECADILIYLELFSQVADFDLVKATIEKFNEVSIRNGFPERL